MQFFEKIYRRNNQKRNEKDDERQDDRNYEFYKTAMDYVLKIVKENKLDNKQRRKSIPIYKIINTCKVSGGNCSKQAARVLEYAKETSDRINSLRVEYGNDNFDSKVFQRKIRFVLNDGLKKIKLELNNKYTIHLVLKELEKIEYKTCLWPILYFISQKNSDIFYEIFKTEDKYFEIKPSNTDFDLQLYSKNTRPKSGVYINS